MARSKDRYAFTLLELLVVLAIIALLMGLLLAAVQKVRDASARLSCQNRMRQLGLALHQHHDTQSAFPSGVRHFVLLPGVGGSLNDDPELYPLMTWHTRLLPYLEQDALWRLTQEAYAKDRYLLDNPPHVAGSTAVTVFFCPADSPSRPANPTTSGPSAALTSYLGVEGVTYQRLSGMLFLDSATRFADVLDGTSNTLFVGERPAGYNGSAGRWYGGWGTWGNTNSFLGVRENFRIDAPNECSLGPYPFQRGQVNDPCAVYHFWSLHSGGANFLFVDGSVRFLPYSAATVLPALATRADGDAAELP